MKLSDLNYLRIKLAEAYLAWATENVRLMLRFEAIVCNKIK